MDTQAKRETFGWTRKYVEPSSPHQELIPWVNDVGRITVNNWTWLLYWPELMI